MPPTRDITEHIRRRVHELFPGATVESIRPIDADAAADDEATSKGMGYGKPLRIAVHETCGARHDLVFHTASANPFGHDWRADRAHEMLLAYDTFGDIPGHVAAVDVGALADDGALTTLRGHGEVYLITEWGAGRPYADDLRRIARDGALGPEDVGRCEALADRLVEVHAAKPEEPSLYRRAIRDLVGSGEGIYGIVDGYPDQAEGVAPERLAAIERGCADWRWRLRGCEHRLARTHGDYHPFNVVFDDDHTLRLLDASRGCVGDPADDVTCMAINYVFFALGHEGTWRGGFAPLWRAFWTRYLEATGDDELLAVAPPFLAWRALVLASPVWYPELAPAARNAILALAERALADGRLDIEAAEELF